MRRRLLPWVKASSPAVCCSSAGLPDWVVPAYQTGMAANQTMPVLFDRALLRARQGRVEKMGAAAFLLDRVAEDMAERLHAVLREFSRAADIGTSGDQVRNALTERVGQLTRVDLPDSESEPLPLPSASIDLAVSALALQFVN